MSGFRVPTAIAGLCLALAALAAGTVDLPTVRAATSGDVYFALAPARLLDTRTTGQPLGAGGSLELQVAGTGQVPADATAVAVNVTATDTTTSSFLTVYPTGEALPLSSNLNWAPAETVANLVIVPVGTGGDLTFYNDDGSADVVVDLQGYFVGSAGGGGEYVPLAPARITDTRTGSGYPNAGLTLGAGSTLPIQVTGVGGVPATGVSAAVLNVTVTGTTSASYLAVYPGSENNPDTSSLNWGAGGTVANRVVVPLSSLGQITVANDFGQADVIVDVSGYFTATASTAAMASLFYPTSPSRILDTRLDGSQPDNASYLGEQFAGVGGISAQATAIVANLTSTDTASSGYYSLVPQETAPSTSDLNWSAGATVANLDIATLNSAGDAYLYNRQGAADAVIDVFGYFVPVSGTNASAVQPCSSLAVSLTPPVSGGDPVGAAVVATCSSGATVQYTYWYRSPGSSVWTSAGPPSASSSFQYSTAGWRAGSYQLMAWASSQAGIFQDLVGSASIIMLTNPASNRADTFVSPCYSSGYASSTCGQAEIAAIDSAQAGEGLPPLNWPSSFFGLSLADQVFIAADQERVSRGLPAIAGLTAAANQNALVGVQGNRDPDGLNVTGAIAYASNWAEDFGPLGATFDWMYNDGPGSFNIDCPAVGGSGCWQHRDDILLNTTSGAMAARSGYTWVGGTACAAASGVSFLDDCALEWVLVPSGSVSYQFTWAEAVGMGA